MNAMTTRTIATLTAVAMLAACASPTTAWDREANAWIGSSFSKLVARYGEPGSIRVEPNGNRGMRYALREVDEKCVQTFVVDKTDTIVGQYHSPQCRA